MIDDDVVLSKLLCNDDTGLETLYHMLNELCRTDVAYAQGDYWVFGPENLKYELFCHLLIRDYVYARPAIWNIVKTNAGELRITEYCLTNKGFELKDMVDHYMSL